MKFGATYKYKSEARSDKAHTRYLSLLIVLITLVVSNFCFVSVSSAVEFGQDATGDPNAVKVGGASGFLYSPRIVLTVAHVIESTGGTSYWEREGVIYKPGLASVDGQKGYRVKKVLVPKTFIHQDNTNHLQAVDDLAIIILSEDIPMANKPVLATEEQMQRFVTEKSKVELVGYGITTAAQRNDPWIVKFNRPPNRLISTLISPEMVIQLYKQYPNSVPSWVSIQQGNFGIIQNREIGSGQLCDGDSGSAFFVEENGVRYVLGMTGQGLINNVCPTLPAQYLAPSMSWVNPAFKLSELIKTAETIVYEDKKAEEISLAEELKAKQEAHVKEALQKKFTISCFKGNSVKRVTAIKPVCPKGYKRK
jgi:hypothetical protein